MKLLPVVLLSLAMVCVAVAAGGEKRKKGRPEDPALQSSEEYDRSDKRKKVQRVSRQEESDVSVTYSYDAGRKKKPSGKQKWTSKSQDSSDEESDEIIVRIGRPKRVQAKREVSRRPIVEDEYDRSCSNTCEDVTDASTEEDDIL